MVQNTKKVLSIALTVALVVASAQIVNGAQTSSPAAAPNAGAPTETAPQTAEELQALVAPIALYPDALVAQILAAVNVSRSGGDRGVLGGAKQKPNRKHVDAGGRCAILGCQRESTDGVSFGAG